MYILISSSWLIESRASSEATTWIATVSEMRWLRKMMRLRSRKP